MGLDLGDIDSVTNFPSLEELVIESTSGVGGSGDLLLPVEGAGTGTGTGTESYDMYYGVRALVGGYVGFEIKRNNKQFLLVGVTKAQMKAHYIVRVQKSPAHSVLETFVDLPMNVKEDFNVPRLDIQQTVDSPNPGNPKELFSEAYAAQFEFEKQRGKKRGGMPLKVLRTHDEGPSQTITIGARQSSEYTRLYLKTVEPEKGKPIQLLRVEVELKSEKSTAVVFNRENRADLEKKNGGEF